MAEKNTQLEHDAKTFAEADLLGVLDELVRRFDLLVQTGALPPDMRTLKSPALPAALDIATLAATCRRAGYLPDIALFLTDNTRQRLIAGRFITAHEGLYTTIADCAPWADAPWQAEVLHFAQGGRLDLARRLLNDMADSEPALPHCDVLILGELDAFARVMQIPERAFGRRVSRGLWWLEALVTAWRKKQLDIDPLPGDNRLQQAYRPLAWGPIVGLRLGGVLTRFLLP